MSAQLVLQICEAEEVATLLEFPCAPCNLFLL